MFSKTTVSVLALSGLLVVPGAATADQMEQTKGDTFERIPGHFAPQKVRPGALDTTIYFDFSQSQLGQESRQRLQQVAQWMKENKDRKVYIEGHTDWIGDRDYNRELSRERAEQAKNYLTNQQGIDPERVEVVGFGESALVADDPGQNRRVVFFTTDEDQQVDAQAQAEAEEMDQEVAQAEQEEPEAEEPEVVGVVGVVEPIQEPQVQVQQPPQPVYEQQPQFGMEQQKSADDRPPHLITPAGMALAVGGGAVGFIDDDARDFTDVGGGWDARLTYGTRSYVAVEAAYIGSAQGIDAFGLDDDTVLLGNGAEANLRINFTRSGVQPYIFGGGGWTNYQLVGNDFNNSNIQNEDNIFHVPAGLGLGFRYQGIMLDLRGTARFAFDDELMDAAFANTEEDASLHSWNAGAKIGWEF